MTPCAQIENRMSTRIGFCVHWTIALAAIASLSANGADKERHVSSIQEFVAAQDRWPELVGRPLRVEGRFTVFGKTEIKFAGCDVRFRSNTELIRFRGDSPNLEVAGQLMKQDGKYVFHIRELRPRETDMERLAHDRLVMDTSQPDSYYELADWARQRGEFYADEDLKKAAEELSRSGLMRAAETLAPDDATGLRELSRKVTQFGLDDRLRLQFLHEASRIEFAAALDEEQPKFYALAARVARELPGSLSSVPGGLDTLRQDYEKAPVAVYRVADEETRRRLERVFYTQLVRAGIEHDADGEGRNGYEIADRIERDLPELADLADEYRQRELDYLSSHIGQLTRQQLLELANRHEQRNDPEQATKVKRRWLQSREQLAKADGPRGLMDLGEEYLNLLNDGRGAARMFKLAYTENPQLSSASDWLVEHGYTLNQGKWTKPGETPATDDDELAEAIREGRPQKGMTGDQVRASLGSAPTSRIRFASAGHVSEVWHFEDLHISIQLSRRTHDKQLIVRRVTGAP